MISPVHNWKAYSLGIRPQTAPGDIHKAIITSTLNITKEVNAATRV